MPLYDFRCQTCEAEVEAYRSIRDSESEPPTHCGAAMVKVHKRAPMGSIQVDACYRCPVTGDAVTSRRQRSEIMKRHNLVDALPAHEVIRDSKKRRERLNALANSGPQISAEAQERLASQAGLA